MPQKKAQASNKRTPPAVYTIPPEQCFAESLALGLMQRAEGNQMALSSMLILLPNRRAVRALRDAFLKLNDGKAMLMPIMRPIGDIDEGDVGALAGSLMGEDTLLPAISDAERRVLLAKLVSHRALREGTPIVPAQAWRLAVSLSQLMDQVENSQIEYNGLKDLVGNDLAHHWQTTLNFLQVVTEHWPKILEEKQSLNPSDRRNKQAKLLVNMWVANPPSQMIIAAGSTGTMQATADILKCVARLPNGAVVLPGLDQAIDEESWKNIDVTHPQAALKNILDHIGEHRTLVKPWIKEGEQGAPKARMQMLNEAFRPAQTTNAWQQSITKSLNKKDILQGLKFITAPTLRTEAVTIALLMRETLEVENKTAALVTPDRQLARHVSAVLKRWNIDVDDSAGTPAINSSVGNYLRLVVTVVEENFSPHTLLSLLHHPLTTFGMKRDSLLSFARRLDKILLRGPRPAIGIEGLLRYGKQTVTHPQEHKRWGEEDQKILQRIARAFKPMVTLFSQETASPAALLKGHIECAETIATAPNEKGAAKVWSGDAGNILAEHLQEILSVIDVLDDMHPNEWAALFDSMLVETVLRKNYGKHPRLFIWGTIEARLQRADLMILGGLNENTWPVEIKPDPWMSRQMRQAFGLPPLERRVGQSAHDFSQAMGAKEVVVTRSAKTDGTETVPSRWLYRIGALLDDDVIRGQDSRYLRWAELLDGVQNSTPVQPPRPTPPSHARPKSLYVTSVELWMRDPYALYAKQILNLRPLDPVDDQPNPAHRGSLTHDILERFLKEDGPTTTQTGLKRLIKIGEEEFAKIKDQPAVETFWWPRFLSTAEEFIENHGMCSKDRDVVALEKTAEKTVPNTDFMVKARADRIDKNKEDGSLTIIDYKTGKPPSSTQMHAGYAPQLPIEAWLAQEGAFETLPKATVASMEFWKLSGKLDEAVEIKSPIKDKEVQTVIEKNIKGLAHLVTTFMDEKTPYLSHPRPAKVLYKDYDHLARVKEWRAYTLDKEEGEL